MNRIQYNVENNYTRETNNKGDGQVKEKMSELIKNPG